MIIDRLFECQRGLNLGILKDEDNTKIFTKHLY